MTGRNGQGGWRPLWLEGRFLKGSRRSQPSEEEEVRSLRSQRGAGRGAELANVDSSGSGRGRGWMKMERRVVLWETERMKYPPKNLAAEKMLTFSRETWFPCNCLVFTFFHTSVREESFSSCARSRFEL